MDLVFKNKKITGILTILPKKIVKFEDEMSNYGSQQLNVRVKLAMGYKEHRYGRSMFF